MVDKISSVELSLIRVTYRIKGTIHSCWRILHSTWYHILEGENTDSADRADGPAYKRTTRAFQSVVDGGADDTVGGITVRAIFGYQEKSFIYG